MDLLERYLQAVKFWLSKEQKQDIIAELSEDLRSSFFRVGENIFGLRTKKADSSLRSE